jgi:hypothetical protein
MNNIFEVECLWLDNLTAANLKLTSTSFTPITMSNCKDAEFTSSSNAPGLDEHVDEQEVIGD